MVSTNDMRNPKIALTLVGQVIDYVKMTPTRVKLMGKLHQPLRTIVHIEPQNHFAYKLVGARAKEGKFIHYHLDPKDPSGKTGYRLIVENTKTDKGRYADTIYLTTDRSDLPLISIPVFGMIW